VTDRTQVLFVGTACLVCCLAFVLALAGATTRFGAAMSVWLGRQERVVVAVVGLGAVTWAGIGHESKRRRDSAIRTGEAAL